MVPLQLIRIVSRGGWLDQTIVLSSLTKFDFFTIFKLFYEIFFEI